jgi:hypothetical protein
MLLLLFILFDVAMEGNFFTIGKPLLLNKCRPFQREIDEIIPVMKLSSFIYMTCLLLNEKH